MHAPCKCNHLSHGYNYVCHICSKSLLCSQPYFVGWLLRMQCRDEVYSCALSTNNGLGTGHISSHDSCVHIHQKRHWYSHSGQRSCTSSWVCRSVGLPCWTSLPRMTPPLISSPGMPYCCSSWLEFLSLRCCRQHLITCRVPSALLV